MVRARRMQETEIFSRRARKGEAVQFFRRRSSALAILLFAVLAFAGCGGQANHPDDGAKRPATRPTIVFMTDFGTATDAVSICKGVMIGTAPHARIMDITHQVTTLQIGEASRILSG